MIDLRIWLGLLGLLPSSRRDPVEHIGDADPEPEPGAPTTSRTEEPRPRLADEDRQAIADRLIPDLAVRERRLRLLQPDPDRQRACIDQGDRRCDGGDALTDLITAHKALERRVTELERRIAAGGAS